MRDGSTGRALFHVTGHPASNTVPETSRALADTTTSDNVATKVMTEQEEKDLQNAINKLKEEIESIFKHWKRDALLEELSRIGVPAGNVRKLDSVYNWEQTKSQGLIMEVNHSTLGPISIPGPVLRMMGLGDIGHRPDPLAPPVLGEQSEEIRRWLENDE